MLVPLVNAGCMDIDGVKGVVKTEAVAKVVGAGINTGCLEVTWAKFQGTTRVGGEVTGLKIYAFNADFTGV